MSSIFYLPGDFVPRTPLHRRSRGPCAPLRSGGSFASLTRGRPPDTLVSLRSLAADPPDTLVRFAHSRQTAGHTRSLRSLAADRRTHSFASLTRGRPPDTLVRFAHSRPRLLRALFGGAVKLRDGTRGVPASLARSCQHDRQPGRPAARSGAISICGARRDRQARSLHQARYPVRDGAEPRRPSRLRRSTRVPAAAARRKRGNGAIYCGA